MTIEEIAAKTEFTAEELQETLSLYGNLSFHTANNKIPLTHRDRYCYLWRNLVFRFSDLLIEYQL